MKLIYYFIFGIAIIILISGCTLTPENVDVTAKAIQVKYDSINSYKATIYSTTSEGHSKNVLREVKKPDRYKDLKYESDGTVHNTFEICNINVAWDYSDGDIKINKRTNQKCNELVTNYFLVIDSIKNIFNYDYSITEEKLEEQDSIKVVLKTKYGTAYTLWFSKDNYQLLKSITQFQDHTQTDIFKDIQLNVKISDADFEPKIASGVKICGIDPSKIEGLEKQLELIIGTENNKKGTLSEEEFKQAEYISKQILEENCEEYTIRTYEQYLGK